MSCCYFRLTFFIAEVCLLAGSVRNAYHTKYWTYISQNPPSCRTLRKGVFGAGAAFIVFTGIVSELYYVFYSKANAGFQAPPYSRDTGVRMENLWHYWKTHQVNWEIWYWLTVFNCWFHTNNYKWFYVITEIMMYHMVSMSKLSTRTQCRLIWLWLLLFATRLCRCNLVTSIWKLGRALLLKSSLWARVTILVTDNPIKTPYEVNGIIAIPNEFRPRMSQLG